MSQIKQKLLTHREVLLLSIISIFILLSPLVVTLSPTILSLDDQNSAFIGDALGGITAPFIGIFGSILVYIAFKVQFNANREIQNQFKIQSENQYFFRLIDNLNLRITATTLLIKDKSVSSYLILNRLNNEIHELLSENRKSLAEKKLLDNPELLDLSHYEGVYLLFGYFHKNHFSNASDIQKALTELPNNKSRKMFLQSIYKEHDSYDRVLGQIGATLFYDCSFEERKVIYKGIMHYLNYGYGGFFDGYFRNLTYLFKFIEENNNQFFLDYMKDNISSYEKIFIFYYIASDHATYNFRNSVKNFHLLDDISSYKSLLNLLLFDDATLHSELNNILN